MLNNDWAKLTLKIETSNLKLEDEKRNPAHAKNKATSFVCKHIALGIEMRSNLV